MLHKLVPLHPSLPLQSSLNKSKNILDNFTQDGAVGLPLERRGALVPPKIDIGGRRNGAIERSGRDSDCSRSSVSSRQVASFYNIFIEIPDIYYYH